MTQTSTAHLAELSDEALRFYNILEGFSNSTFHEDSLPAVLSNDEKKQLLQAIECNRSLDGFVRDMVVWFREYADDETVGTL